MQRFFEEVLTRMEKKGSPDDQFVINDVLAEGYPLRWDLLPDRYYCRTLGFPPPKGIVLHHATMTFRNSIPGKIEQLKLVRLAETGGLSGRAWACAVMGTRKIKRLLASVINRKEQVLPHPPK